MVRIGTRWSKPLIGLLLALGPTGTLSAEGPRETAEPIAQGRAFEAGLQLGYLSGDFGADADTEIESLSARLSWRTRRTELRVSLPFLRLTSRGDVQFVGGRPVVPVAGLPVPGLPGGPAEAESPPERRTLSGNGDAKLRGEVFVLTGTARRPWLSLSAEVKAPTGDADRGLGTGETDVGGGFGLVQPLGRASLMVDASYTRLGDPAGFDFENVVTTGVGVSVGIGSRAGRSLYAYLENRTHPLEGLEDRRDLQVGGNGRLGAATGLRWNVGVLYGLTDSAEDFGMAFGLGKVF